MKYLQNTPFSSGGNSNSYRSNWDRIFNSGSPKPEPVTEEVVVNTRYKHFKGGDYIVLGIGTHTETGEELVVYQKYQVGIELPDDPGPVGKIWVRPKVHFLDYKMHEGEWVRRFKKAD